MNFHFADGLLREARERDRALVQRMAQDLLRYDAWRTESDAIRTLMMRGYRPLDVAMLADEARVAVLKKDTV